MAGLVGSAVDKALFRPSRLLLLLLVAAPLLLADVSRAEDVLLTVNVKKPVALTSDKFLSYTLDPTVVLTGNALTENPERSVNMAKALAPAYVRIGGPRSNSYTFERPHRQQDEQDPGFTFTEGDWIVVHRWAENAGLDVLACIAPQHSESGGREPGWDSRNALDLISFSDHMGFNTSWQLGYECQTRCDASGIDIGRDVMRLRSMLDAFPRYSKSVIAGPDVVTYRTKHQQQYLQDYLSVAGTALSAITWHPDFASITLDPEGVSMHHDNLALDRDGLYRVIGRLISKKPLWLAESKPEECKKQFLGALVWTRRLGNAARLGVQVIMRQPGDSNLIQPTPDYWVSVLHKTLVGREVLDARIATGNRTHVHFYCQCTRPSSRYEKGSLTIFGINLTPSKVVASLKGLKIKTLHKYILLPGFDAENRMFSETVLLNNEPLNLLNERELPEIKPAISSSGKGVALKLPSGGIGFWVVPGLKIKSCGGLEDDTSEKMLLKKLTKRLEEADSDEDSAREDDHHDDELDDEENASEERRSSSGKSSRTTRRRRKHRGHSEEDEAERRYRRLETRMDLERLEKLLRRRDGHDDRKVVPRGGFGGVGGVGRTAYFGFEEQRSHERTDDEETGAEMRAKLEEYKTRLREYETRGQTDPRSRSKVTETPDHETIDSDKVVEALTLIAKMENAMRTPDQTSVDVATPMETLKPGDAYDMTSGLADPTRSEKPEDVFLDELLKSEKIKRTSVPAKIEDQLRAIYRMLAEEKVRRQRNPETTPDLGTTLSLDAALNVEPKPVDAASSLVEIDETLSRARRDTDKKFGEDPLGLRKDGLFRRRAKMNDDARERRMDRRRRKDRDDRKDGQPVIFDPRTAADSNENNFYGFQQREPLKGFPEGDVFMTTGTSSEEAAKDYDYVTDDEDHHEQGRPARKSSRGVAGPGQVEPEDATWVEEDNTELSHVPKEFFEDVKMSAPRVHENLKEYGELWEAESLGQEASPQDRFDPEEEDDEAGKIVQERRPDAREDRRAKETAVRKLIGYYDDPRSHQDDEDEEAYVEDVEAKPEKPEKTRGASKHSSRTSARQSDARDTRQGQGHQQGQRNAAAAISISRKRVKDLGSAEFGGGFADYDSMHFGRAAMSSAEREALYVPAARPAASRTRRSTEDVERIMDHEMIIQDDANLRDCECRVNRGARLARRRGERRHRPERRFKEDRGDRGRFRNREKPPTTKPGGRFDEDYMRTTRVRRQAGSLSREAEEDAEETVESVEDSGSDSEAVGESDETLSGEAAGGGEEVTSDEDAEEMVAAPANPIVQEATRLPAAGDDDETSTKVDDEDVKVTLERGRLDDESLAVAEETSELRDFETDNKVKRHNEASDAVELAPSSANENAEEAEVAAEPKVNEGSEVVEDLEKTVERRQISANDTQADQLFLASQREDPEEQAKTLGADAAPANLARDDLGLGEPGEDLQAASAADKASPVGQRSVGEAEKAPDSSATTATSADPAIQAENGAAGSTHAEDSPVGATRELIEAPEALIPKSEDAAESRVKLEAKDTSDERTTERTRHSPKVKQTPRHPRPAKEIVRPPKDGARPARKTAPKTKPADKVTDKVSDQAKVREARLVARTEALQALRRENESKKARKSLETTTKTLANEQARFQAMQRKRTEQLEKLRDKLRTKRAKIVREYRDELIGELDRASVEEKNLKRRDIVGTIDDVDREEFGDIVDREKLDYVLRNRPIDYETKVKRVENPEELEGRTRYVPKMVEIVRPLPETRERKVRDRGQPTRHATDPKLRAYSDPEESTNSEAIRRSLSESEDVVDHKVERRAGRSYYSLVESLENPRIRYARDDLDDFGSEDSGEAPDSQELGRVLDDISIEDTGSEDDDESHGDHRRRHAISRSPEEDRKSSSRTPGDPPRHARDAPANRFMCLKEDPEESSIERQDELFRVVRENDHYVAMPAPGPGANRKSDNEEKYVSKKKHLKDSDYDRVVKYKAPKYARLAAAKVEAEGHSDLQPPRVKVENNQAKTLRRDEGDEDELQEVAARNSRKKLKSTRDELYDVQRERISSEEGEEELKRSELEAIDDLDLDEALNSSRYELLMLIPVKSQRRSRQRRQAGNELIRDDESSAANEIPEGLIGRSGNDSRDESGKIGEGIAVTDRTDKSSRTGAPEDVTDNDNEDADESTSVVSTIVVVENSGSSGSKGNMMDDLAVEGFAMSVPVQSIDDKGNDKNDDDGLPGLIEEAIPKLEATVTGGLGKARHISESFEKFIDGFDDAFNRKQAELEARRPDSAMTTNLHYDAPISSNVFEATIANVRKFFDFLAGMIHIIRFN